MILNDRAWRRRHNGGLGLDECLQRRWLLRDVYVAVFVSRAVRKVLANFLRNFAEVDEAISDIDVVKVKMLWKRGERP